MIDSMDDLGTRAMTSSRRTVRTALLSMLLVLLGATAFVAASGTDAHAATAAATHKIVIRPVTTHGYPVKGYTVVTSKGERVQCYEHSPVAVDAGIAFCGASADYTVACWKSHTSAHVLCLDDPFTKVLRSVRLDGAFPRLTKPHHASPLALTLTNGQRYLIRDGGAWASPKEHPTWVGWYFERKVFTHAVYGPRHGDGINRAHKQWFVTTYVGADARGHGTRHEVATAYYVGTAR